MTAFFGQVSRNQILDEHFSFRKKKKKKGTAETQSQTLHQALWRNRSRSLNSALIRK